MVRQCRIDTPYFRSNIFCLKIYPSASEAGEKLNAAFQVAEDDGTPSGAAASSTGAIGRSRSSKAAGVYESTHNHTQCAGRATRPDATVRGISPVYGNGWASLFKLAQSK